MLDVRRPLRHVGCCVSARRAVSAAAATPEHARRFLRCDTLTMKNTQKKSGHTAWLIFVCFSRSCPPQRRF